MFKFSSHQAGKPAFLSSGSRAFQQPGKSALRYPSPAFTEALRAGGSKKGILTDAFAVF
jgi:hypothetical protein